MLTTLAVDPAAVKMIFQGSTLSLMWQLFRQSLGEMSFEPGVEADDEADLGLAKSAALLERRVALEVFSYLTRRRCGWGMGSGTRPSAYAATWFTRYSAAV